MRLYKIVWGKTTLIEAQIFLLMYTHNLSSLRARISFAVHLKRTQYCALLEMMFRLYLLNLSLYNEHTLQIKILIC